MAVLCSHGRRPSVTPVNLFASGGKEEPSTISVTEGTDKHAREAPSESQVRGLMYQAVLGAKHCLDRGVFHRDIKLDNYVINTATKEVKLIDFG
ncbi:hypothetical protein Q8A67_012431 [Cirrhinus molitorella]|uniref:non-specific serine/threonine protein kinase n=1 Tax=Cirrhinus molitorella TaxID=172907 RepID=A0AA88TP31_9TELE|nr:hypothetical protein Q8A67_012431 [Cirrhinus molitorella]